MRSLRPATVLALLAVDRATKLWAMRDLRVRGPIPVLPFFEFSYVENTGAAFGMGRGANGAFIAISVVMIAVLVRILRRWPKDDFCLQAGGTLVLAGALGNLYDRLFYGYVVDFLFLHHWPVFNAADSCITVGAVLLAWGLKDPEKKAPINPS
ncbi:MAG TPA: signal peptidase II [Elusimicrobia bacterium]|nr:MAG: signal peptidase II [Elusimicrobia bacterium GWA2_66_18]OGR77913.1 MAG: signal peptidase II [Elusimicrobia bacterium GWC2_65_9]HAZ08359.1 signal peptidase II [Elusimicrobiota bacterium]